MLNIPLHVIHPKDGEFTSPSLVNCPAPIIDDWFHQELIRVGGRDRFGEPRLRIIWMQSELRKKNGSLGMKYPLVTWINAYNEFCEVGTPRFMIEQKIDPVFIDLQNWKEDLQGPKPVRGVYRDLMCIQTIDGKFCYPDRRHITELAAMDYRRRHDAMYGASHEEEAPQYIKDMKQEKLRRDLVAREEKSRTERRFMVRDHYRERKRRILHNLPDEGRRPDPYIESKKQQERAMQYLRPDSVG